MRLKEKQQKERKQARKRAAIMTMALAAGWGCGLTAFAQPKTMPDGTVFDAEFYAETYPDVKAAMGNDEKALYGHYTAYGKTEGRLPCATENTAMQNVPDGAVSSKETLAISGLYEELRGARDGLAIACKDGKWGLVTYDNQVLVPFQYAQACWAPNDDGQTFFGNNGDYRVYNKEGKEIFRTNKPIRAVSEGVVLWTKEDAETDYSFNFGYVRLDGTVIYESDGEDIYEQSGAVGFSEGYAFCSSGVNTTEYRLGLDGSNLDIFRKREAVLHPETSEPGYAQGLSTNFLYPIGACFHGYYVDRGISMFEDSNGRIGIYDAEGTKEYICELKTLAEYAGYSWDEDEDLRWSIKGFYHNGNYVYSYGTLLAASVGRGDEVKYYLIDTAKQVKAADKYGNKIPTVTKASILAEGQYISISDTAYWLVQKDGRWGYIDHSGKVKAMFDDATQFYNGTAMVIKDGYAYLIDENMKLSEWKIPAQSVASHEDMFIVTTADGQLCYSADRMR